jgi:serine/threonine protein phosphatase PrpC
VAATVVEVAVAAARRAGEMTATDALAAALEAANAAVVGVDSGASTLVIALVGRDGRADLVRVGDSTAFRLAAGAWTEVFAEVGEADGEAGIRTPVTAALPCSDPEVEGVQVDLAPGEALLLLSDGVADPLRDGPTTVAPGLAAALADPPHPLVLAAQADFSRQGCQDDRTIAGIWLVAPAD